MWNLKNKPPNKKSKSVGVKNRLVVIRGEGGWGRDDLGEGGPPSGDGQ